MKEKLSLLLKKEVVDSKKLFGDASYRTYHRLFFKNGGTAILMEIPKGKMSVSEEITNLKEKTAEPFRAEPSFINVQRYLASLKIPVPQIECFSLQDGWIVLQDLGDVKLLDVVASAPRPGKMGWYKKAIDLLVELQTKAKPSAKTVVYQRSFDATLFNWEFDHFWEYYPLKASTQEKEIFSLTTRKITQELCKLPQGFTHRDYQSKNLMIQNGKIIIIDFQDALLGPKVYDVVCLLRDSYIDLTLHLEELLGYYCERSKTSLKNFRREFDLQTVQRKLKDTGRFIFIDQVKKNPNFIQYIPLSLNYVEQALKRLEDCQELYKMLKKYIKEWK